MITCTFTIQCKNLLSYKDLAPNLKKYVPSDGIIQKKISVKIAEGSSAYDLTKLVCEKKDIQMSSRYTPAYESYYIESINNLAEFDGGPMSGWIYKVNGIAPNYGCSSYDLKDGDDVLWGYTCTGDFDV